MCIHCRSFLHSVLQNSCSNRQHRWIKAATVTRTASWSWSQTAQATRQVLLHLQVKQTCLSGNASSNLEIIANNRAAAAPIYIVSSSESEEQDNEFSRLPLLSDGASSDFEIIASTSAGASIYLSSLSESQDQDSEACKRPSLSDVASSDSEIMPSTVAGAPIYVSSSSESDDQDSGALVPGGKLYSIGFQELSASLRQFLAEAYTFFTSSHQLESAGQRMSLTTYRKAQERVLCEYCLFISLKYVMFGLFRISNAVCSILRGTWHKPMFAVLS